MTSERRDKFIKIYITFKVGAREGTNYSINVPLKDGIDDINYMHIFKPVMESVMQHYQPSVIVLQVNFAIVASRITIVAAKTTARKYSPRTL